MEKLKSQQTKKSLLWCSIKRNLQNVARLVIKWFWIILAMAIFVIVTSIVGEWLNGWTWIVFGLDIAFCWLFWILLNKMRVFKYRLGENRESIMLSLLFLLALLTLAAVIITTFALAETLLVRLNILIFPIIVILVFHLFVKLKVLKQGRIYIKKLKTK